MLSTGRLLFDRFEMLLFRTCTLGRGGVNLVPPASKNLSLAVPPPPQPRAPLQLYHYSCKNLSLAVLPPLQLAKNLSLGLRFLRS